MKIAKASTIHPAVPGWYCHLSSEEMVLIRQFMGALSGDGPNTIAMPMFQAMKAAGFNYVKIFPTISPIAPFNPDALERIKADAAQMENL